MKKIIIRKRKNAFTLIELLAIIVILAIIAVITVPIILNIIENSKQGAVKDSAYGYKEAINKFYVSKLAGNKDFTISNDTYTVEQLKNLGVSINGKEPESNSWITIENNNVKSACLQFDEYKVEITNGDIGNAEKDECTNTMTIASCPGCVYAHYTETKNYGLNGTGTELTDYKNDYRVINKNYFLGHILDSDGKIERAFACGIYTNGTPFCVEGTTNGSKDTANRTLLNSEELWNGTNCSVSGNNYTCGGGSIIAASGTTGVVVVMSNGSCFVVPDGTLYCS